MVAVLILSYGFLYDQFGNSTLNQVLLTDPSVSCCPYLFA